MPTFHVTGTTSTDVSLKVELTDEEIEGKHPDDIVDLLMDRFHDEAPSTICAQCSGWGQEFSRDVSDEYTMIISDEEHNIVFDDDKLMGSFAEYDEKESEGGGDGSS